MADPNTTPAVVYRKNTPHYELTAEEIGYPVLIKQSGREHWVNFLLSRWSSEELAEALQDSTSELELKRAGMDIPELRTAGFRRLVDAHFLRYVVDGLKTQPPAKQRQELDAAPYLKDRIFTEGIRGSYDDLEADVTEREEDVFQLAPAERIEVPLVRPLYDPESHRRVEVSCCHVLTAILDIHLQKRKRATVDRLKQGRRTKWARRTSYKTLEQLYDEMALEARGFLIKGEPCLEKNRQEWLPLMPLSEKLQALDVAFEGVEEKNY